MPHDFQVRVNPSQIHARERTGVLQRKIGAGHGRLELNLQCTRVDELALAAESGHCLWASGRINFVERCLQIIESKNTRPARPAELRAHSDLAAGHSDL